MTCIVFAIVVVVAAAVVRNCATSLHFTILVLLLLLFNFVVLSLFIIVIVWSISQPFLHQCLPKLQTMRKLQHLDRFIFSYCDYWPLAIGPYDSCSEKTNSGQ